MEKKNGLDEVRPKGYAKTSPTETTSRDILYSLIDRKYIQGEINVQDKLPNTDGLLDITDEQLVSIGKMEVQLKTLAPENSKQPKYSCDRQFLAFCRDSYLPVVLIVVDIQHKKAYWKHIDSETISEAAAHITGETYTIHLPLENVLDGTNNSYLSAWKAIVESVKNKVQNYDLVIRQRDDLQDRLNLIEQNLQPATTLTESDIEEIHVFLDHYNFILDKELKVVKDALYYNYWKIGIVILSYHPLGYSYFLYPILKTRNEPLIKQVRDISSLTLENIFFENDALFLIGRTTTNSIRESPLIYAYHLMRRDAVKVIGKINLPVDDEFIAREYLWSFVNSFHAYFGQEKAIEIYSLAALKRLLFVIMPVVIETNSTFADHITEFNHNIDQYKDRRVEPHYLKRINEAIGKLEAGYTAKFKVTVSSELYNIKLIQYYIGYLEGKSETHIKSCYAAMKTVTKPNVPAWHSWEKTGVLHNLTLFFENFYRIYKSCVLQNFIYLQSEISLFENYDLLVYAVRFREDRSQKPMLIRFKLQSEFPKNLQVLVFDEDDPKCPISMEKVYKENNRECVYEKINYQLIEIATRPLDFLFEISPTYSFMNAILTKKIEKLFDAKEKQDRTGII